MKKDYLPGWLLMLGVVLVSIFVSRLIVIRGNHPVETALLTIVIGILLRNIRLVPKMCLPGVKAFEKLLILGIVLIGASLNYKTIGSQGLNMLVVIVATMNISFFIIYWMGRFFLLPKPLALLLSVGTTICGGSAIAVTAPLIKAKEEETSYAIGTIALWGFLAILFYPKIGQLWGVSDINFGIFAGTAIHSTPQVVAAGFIFSDLAGKTATAVKLPLAFFVALWYSKIHLIQSKKEGVSLNLVKAFPWFLFGYFLMAGFNTLGYLSQTGISAFNSAGRFLILLGLAGIGMNTVFRSFKSVGLKPLIVGFLGSVVVAVSSIIMITLLF